MEAGGARDLARIQRPLRTVQDAQHFCRRDDRTYRFARLAPDEFSVADSLLAGWLGFASLCLEEAEH